MKINKLFVLVTTAAVFAVSSTITAFAYSSWHNLHSLFVGTEQFISGNQVQTGASVEGVSYNDAVPVAKLSLDNANITSTHQTFNDQCGITSISTSYSLRDQLNINLTNNNYIGGDGMTTGIYSGNVNFNFIGTGNLEITGTKYAFHGYAGDVYTFRPTEGYKMTIYVGSSADNCKKIAEATAKRPFSFSSDDSKYFFTLTHIFNYRYLKIETEQLPPVEFNTTGDTEHAVMGKYLAEPEPVYSVDIEWGGMNFTYSESVVKRWNTETLVYDEEVTDRKWSCDEGADKITVTNHSDAEVAVDLSYTPSEELNIGGSITFDGENRTLASAVGTDVGSASSLTARFKPVDYPTKEFANGTAIGKITVTLTKGV